MGRESDGNMMGERKERGRGRKERGKGNKGEKGK